MSLCPICFDAAGALTDGARMGALVLAIVASAVIAGFVRFGWRVMRSADSPVERVERVEQ